MDYLLAIFISPLYFAIKGKWGACILNSIFYGIALICLISIIGIPVAVFFWFVAMIHAVWDLRKQMMTEHATIMATKMAEVMRQPPTGQS